MRWRNIAKCKTVLGILQGVLWGQPGPCWMSGSREFDRIEHQNCSLCMQWSKRLKNFMQVLVNCLRNLSLHYIHILHTLYSMFRLAVKSSMSNQCSCSNWKRGCQCWRMNCIWWRKCWKDAMNLFIRDTVLLLILPIDYLVLRHQFQFQKCVDFHYQIIFSNICQFVSPELNNMIKK